jgi:replicative DNA helicase
VKQASKLRLAEPPPIAGRPPPHDLDAEAAVLAAILRRSESLDDVPDLKPEHFFSEANGRIFETALALAAEGQPVDPVTIATRLRDQERLQQVGGAAYLAELVEATAYVRNAGAYGDTVVRKSRRRQVIAAAQMIAAEGYGDLDQESEDAWLDRIPQRLQEHDAERVDAVHIGEAMVRTWKERQEFAREGRVRLGPGTGVGELDRRTGGLRPGKVTTIAARSGIGKTALALQAAAHVAAHGDGVLVFELEAPEEECVDRLQYATAGVDGSRLLRGEPLPDADMKALTSAAVSMNRSPLWVVTRSDITVTDIRASSRRLARALERREGGPRLKLVIVDYVQLVSARDMPERGANREAQVSHVSRNLKRLAMDLGVHVMVLAQLNKDGDKRGEDRRPRTSDLRESSAIENDSDHIVLIFNPHALARSRGERDGEATDDVELILGKNRGGRPGTVHAQWIPSQQSYRCVEQREWQS